MSKITTEDKENNLMLNDSTHVFVHKLAEAAHCILHMLWFENMVMGPILSLLSVILNRCSLLIQIQQFSVFNIILSVYIC